jgi:hypothetical protein
MTRGLLMVAAIGAALGVAAGNGSAEPAVASAAGAPGWRVSGVARLDRGIAVNVATVIPAPGVVSAPKALGAISGAFVARLATSAVLVGLLVAWIIVRMRQRSRR